ncbi:thioredoxin [Thiomonas sp.]|uniref:thioredoxin n=1 Tax=Thiomonas sp. TaxID=2047785 RepID=UPI00262B0E35|nr:thioredoxin [Thiomonas sp.]
MNPAGTCAAPAGDWIVACLCAQWCGICRGWRDAYRELAQQSADLLPASRWLWVDVESQADALGDFEPENFPVLAVQQGARLLYCAALPQQAGNWRRMVQSLGALDEEQAQRWAAQLQDLGLDLRRLHDEAD